MGNYVIAKYIRLSLDDAQTDSMSIENQRLMLNRHIADLDIPNAEVIELVDNGFSGTTFERPGVQELLELVRQGKVNCIAVKDFSRFGRNAIETGYFIERMFPLYRIRFISLVESFDSDDHPEDTGGLEVSFHFLKHEYYSRDLSVKIKSARREKMRRGEAVTKNCVFGYTLDERRKMIPDERAAETIQLIFRMYAEGRSLSDIQRRLYSEKRPSPAEYKKKALEPRCVWEKSVLLKMLRDEQYVGTYIAGRTTKPDLDSKKIVRKPESEWYRIPEHHPAIVEKSVFDAVQTAIGVKGEPLRRRARGTNERYGGVTSPLKGKVFCGSCGHALRLSSTKNAAFHCNFTRAAPDEPCHKLKYPASELENVLFGIISKQAQVILNTDSLGGGYALDAQTENQADCERTIARNQDEKRALYERFILQEMDAAAYKAAKAALDAELLRLTRALDALNTEAAAKTSGDALRKVAEMCENALTRPLADALIDRVRVFPGNRIEIEWKVADFAS
jgi:DNA invertase Pin-like site-specific DNA recombinase